ncbi:hypothetical protein Nmel_014407 [Mimus melanotis]
MGELFLLEEQKSILTKKNAVILSRHGSWREPVNPYYVNTGYALAPATSANDSEQQSMSSDADTMSLTDSSVTLYLTHEMPSLKMVCKERKKGYEISL